MSRPIYTDIDEAINKEIRNIVECGHQTVVEYLKEPATNIVYEEYGQCIHCNNIIRLDDLSEEEYDTCVEYEDGLGQFECCDCVDKTKEDK